MGSGTSKPGWYPGEPTGEVLDGECSCDPAVAGLGSGGDGATTAGTTPSSQKTGGSFSTNESRQITSLPVVELTDMEFIANGTFCAVFACKYRGWNVVAKRVRADLPLTERRAALANLWTEYDCLRPLRHPNVIDVYGMCRVKCRDDYCDWNEKDVCLLLEQLALGTVGHLFGTTYDVEKNLATALARSRKMKMVPFRCRLDRALELALALKYVHGGPGIGTMMHRDIKSVNVGFALNGSLKLMDFGLSKIVAPDGAPENDTYQMTGEVGSYRYMAPELVRHEPYNAKADIYSWAILSWEVLAVSRPYSGITESSFIKRVVMDGHRPELRKSWPERLRALLASAWHADFSKRPTAAEIVSVLEEIKADLPEREQRRPSTTAPSFGSATHSRSNSRTQRSVSAPGSIYHARGPSIHSGGGGGGSGGGNVLPAASPARRRVSLPLTRPPPAVKRRWSFVAKASSRARKEESKTKATLPLPPTRSVSSTTTTANTAEDDESTGVAADDVTSLPCRRHHQEGKSQREIIAETLAREAEVAQQEASAKQVMTMRALRDLGRTVGRVADRERRYAEHQARGVDETGLRVGAGIEEGKGGEEEEAGGGVGAGLRNAGKDGIFDVASDPSQAATEEVLARSRRNSSAETATEELPARLLHQNISQETAENVPISVRRHSSNSQERGEVPARMRRHSSLRETREEMAPRVERHTSLEATAGEVDARADRHTRLPVTAGAAVDRLNRGSSLSKLWPSKSNWSNNPEDSSAEPWAWRTSRNGSVGTYVVTTILPGDEHIDNDGISLGHPAAMSAGAAAGGRFAPVAPTGVRDLRKRGWPVKSPKNPRAYALETNSFNLLEQAPL